VDVALVNGEVFMNLATAGPVSEVSSKDMSGVLKKALGPAAIAVSGGWPRMYGLALLLTPTVLSRVS
jgi:hypothetical protein